MWGLGYLKGGRTFRREVLRGVAGLDLRIRLLAFGRESHIVFLDDAVPAMEGKNSAARSWHQNMYSR